MKPQRKPWDARQVNAGWLITFAVLAVGIVWIVLHYAAAIDGWK